MPYIEEINILAAFIGGLISFMSPCVFPVAIGYITYISGVVIEEELENNKLLALKRTIAFILGFTIIFMILGISVGILGKYLQIYKSQLSKIGGIFIILMGFRMLNIIKLNVKVKRFRLPKEVNGQISSLLVGMAMGIGWTPCIGSILGAILFYAGSQGTVGKGALLLLIYSLGFAVPFIVIALLVDKIAPVINRFEKYRKMIIKIGGVLMITIGLIIFFGKMSIFLKFSS